MNTIQEIDKRIRALEQELQSLKTQRNTLLPLCRLPVELFVKVLREYCSWKTLLVINATCKRFKQHTENEHVLWSIPPLAYYKQVPDNLAELFIRRSGSVPLTFSAVQGKSMGNYRADQLNIIASQLHRAKKLEVVISDDVDCAAFMQSLHDTPTEHMKQLSLGQWYGSSQPMDIHSTLGNGSLPDLVTLALFRVDLRGLPQMMSLQRLSLSRVGCNHEVLRTGLTGLNQLQQLRISHPDLDYNGTVVDRVDLPNLQELHLDLDTSSLSAILDLLPNPQVSFTVFTTITARASVPSLAHPAAQKAISRVMQFWRVVSDRPTFGLVETNSWFDVASPPSGHHYVEMRGQPDGLLGEDELMASITIEVGNLISASPYMADITKAHINMNEDSHHVVYMHEGIDLDLLIGLKELTLKMTVGSSNPRIWRSRGALHDLQTWLEKRKHAGAPLTSVLFQNCTPDLWKWFEYLRDSSAALQVQWEGEEGYQINEESESEAELGLEE
jgi:hypothetical protein